IPVIVAVASVNTGFVQFLVVYAAPLITLEL
ncbi:hypothetical protein C5S35_01415, partial [Candidatus Methanophagaceae archaeon]